LTVIAAVLLLLMAGSEVALAQGGTDRGDPFARLDAQLSDAASRTLERIVQPEAATLPTPEPAETEWTGAPPRARQTARQRVERLRPLLDPILRRFGVPTEFAAVVLVESGGDPGALSPKGARGLWQLMPDTARRYGLVVDKTRDDRLDILKSTRAAAQYLRDLHDQFQGWPLALAAYNAGEQAVSRAINMAGTANFSELVTRRAIPAETRAYVPAVLSAAAAPRARLATPQSKITYAGFELTQ
jgi:soluble lytic murein transglycosylase-like protein